MAQGVRVVHMCAGQRQVIYIQMYSLHAFASNVDISFNFEIRCKIIVLLEFQAFKPTGIKQILTPLLLDRF